MSDPTDGIPQGVLGRTPGRTLGEGECAVLMSMLRTIGDIHTNREAAAHSVFGELTLAGPVLAAAVAGLSTSSGPAQAFAQRHGITPLAGLGMEARYRAPFVVGDTVWAESSVDGVRASASRPGQGVLTVRDRAFNQRNELVMELIRFQLFERSGR